MEFVDGLPVEDPQRFCSVPICNQPADRHHLIRRSVLPKRLWKDEKYILDLCRIHHTEVHSVGEKEMFGKYGMEAEWIRYKNLTEGKRPMIGDQE